MKNLFLFVFILFFLPKLLISFPGYFPPWGKDQELTTHNQKFIKEDKKNSIFVKAADVVIKFHQKTLSPIGGSRSNFRPTSSRYMQLSMQRYGFFKGFIMGCDRLIRENDDKWVYRTITIDNTKYKYDPAVLDKYKR